MIERTDAGTVAVVSLANGPVNVMDTAALRALTSTLNGLVDDPAAAVVVTGSGRAFSAGVDLRSLVAGGDDYVREFLPALNDALLTAFTFPKPLVAAVNGHAIAGGAVLACCADLRLMADGKGRIGVPEIKVGVPFPRVPMEVLVHAVGARAANRLILRADTLLPADALALGAVDEVLDAAALADAAVAAAASLAESVPADTFAITKRQLRRETVERIERYRADEDAEIDAIWKRRAVDGWVEKYLAAATGKS